VTENWWQRELRCIAVADREEACTRFTAALVRFEENVVLQGIVSFALVQPLMDQLTRVVASAGETGPRVMAGYGGHEESQMVRDLWNVSRGRLDLDAFLARHGYHGPREGEISGVVWREDPSPVLEILEGYRGLGEEADPTKASALRATERQRAERKVLAALPASQRIWGRTILALSRRYAPLRGVGKTAFLQSLDIARAAARRLGTCLAAEGVLDDPADIFFLTKGEVCQAQWAEARGQVEVRRERYRTYENVELPVAWRGMPFPRAVEATVDEGTEGVLEGVAASPGMVEGRVRVMADHGESAVDPGDILVAHVTDPSWASALFLSSALVTDIGGLLSHAAVVARELGIPCVAGTRVATKVLRTGDRCRVNGTTGRVEVLERIAPDEAKRSE
jgi:pyruvate,water dikinase